ncbi:MAG: cytochrome c biogenesis protein CcsA [Rhodovibrionaceae bacterium]|nr:cytochrome c biogenesis protein CcsA [Rhodovibrionaceae bacterium]
MAASLILGIAAILALIPVSLQSFRAAAGAFAAPVGAPGRLYWLLLAVAALGLFARTVHLLSGGWQPGISGTIWVSMTATLLVFALVTAAMPVAWRLTPLLGVYLGLLGVIAVLLPEGPAYAGSFDLWLAVHVGVSLAAYALVSLGALSALAVFLQERALKRKEPGTLTRSLPSVADGERLLVLLLTAAAVVLALGILTGMAELYVISGSVLVFNHKILLSLLGFVAVVGLLLLHQRIGLRGRKAARLMLLAFLLLTLGYPGVKFVTDVIMTA